VADTSPERGRWAFRPVPPEPHSIVEFIRAGTLDAELAATVWLLLGGQVPVLHFLRSVILPTFLPMLGYSALGVLLAVAWIGGLNIVACLLVLGPLIVVRWAMSQYQAERAAQAAAMRAFIQVIETKDLYTRGHLHELQSLLRRSANGRA